MLTKDGLRQLSDITDDLEIALKVLAFYRQRRYQDVEGEGLLEMITERMQAARGTAEYFVNRLTREVELKSGPQSDELPF